MRIRRFAITVTLQLSCTSPTLVDPHTVSSLWEGDVECIGTARSKGQHFASSDVQVWVHPEAEWARAFVANVEVGVRTARGFLGEHGLTAKAPVEMYVCDREVVAHAPGGPFVFLSRAMTEDGDAPWLHEVTHVLLRGEGGLDWLTDFDEETVRRRMPLWLVEGLTEYVAQAASERAGIANVGPFATELAALDARCKDAAATSPPDVLDKIGRPGHPDDWFGPGRPATAAVFYPCASAFVKWLVDRHGLDELLRAQRDTPDEQTSWERSTGVELAAELALWREQLDIAGQ